MLGLVRRRLAQALRPVSAGLALRTPHPVSPVLMGQQHLSRAPLQVGRAWLSGAPTPQVVSFPPLAPPPPLPKDHKFRVQQLSDKIMGLEHDYKELLHLSMLLFGLMLTTLPLIPGTVGDCEGETSSLQVDTDAAFINSKVINTNLSQLKTEVARRNMKVETKKGPSA